MAITAKNGWITGGFLDAAGPRWIAFVRPMTDSNITDDECAAIAAHLASIEAVEKQRDALLAAAKISLPAVQGFISLAEIRGEHAENAKRALTIIKAAIAATELPNTKG